MNPIKPQIPIDARVRHAGHGLGTIVAYNQRPEIGYAMSGRLEPRAFEGCLRSGLITVDSFYSGKDYPYVVQFDNGYRDVYSPLDLEEVCDVVT